jgi:uncharacterized membrane protein YdjX (TVP38/TMEM64 family)
VRHYLLLVLVLVAAVALAVFARGRVDLADALPALVSYARGAGAMGIVLFAVAYVVSAVALLPGAVLTLAAGFVYGPLLGMAIVSPVSVLAATCAFLLGRTVARDWIRRRVADQPRFAAVDEAVGREGFKIVALLRLSPLLPFNLLNYALGLTKVRLRDYVLASWLGMLPGTALYVYLGSLVTNVSGLLGGRATSGQPAAARWLYWAGLAATLAVAILVTRIARRALAQVLDDRQAPAAADSHRVALDDHDRR